MVFDRNKHPKVNPFAVSSIIQWHKTAKKENWIDEKGYLTKEGVSLLRSIRWRKDGNKWDDFDHEHLSVHVKKIWKYMKYARTYFDKPSDLNNDDWEYLNIVDLLEDAGVLKFA